MSDTRTLEWLNENSLRCYPLQEDGNKVFLTSLSLNRCFLDALLLYTEAVDRNAVELESIAIDGQQVTITVTGQPEFTFNKAAGVYPVYVYNTEGSVLALGDEFAHVNADVSFTGIRFEPTCVVDTSGAWRGVTSLAEHTGIVEFKEGFQFGLSTNQQTIKMVADRNAGKPISCQRFFEGVVDDDCGEIISYINGVASPDNPGKIVLKAGPHVQIFDDPENHRIYVGLDFDSLDVCQPVRRPVAFIKP